MSAIEDLATELSKLPSIGRKTALRLTYHLLKQPPEQARRLAVATFAGASELARAASEPLETLRERVTSRGGTTYAALTAMERAQVKEEFVAAMHAAVRRAAELGDEFGR